MNIFKHLKHFFLKNWSLKWLDLTSEPYLLSPFVVWEKWIELADWRRVYKCWVKRDDLRDDCGNSIYQGRVRNLLQLRMLQIQLPVLPDEFFAKHHNVVVVKSGLSHADVASKVKKLMTHRMRPQFVVDDKHKLLGFALTPKLIIAGVSAIRIFPYQASAVIKKGGFRLLSKEDAMLVTRQKDILSEMMKEAHAPDLSEVKSFSIELHVSEFADRALLWHFSPRGDAHLITCSDTSAYLLVKL